VSRFPLSLIEQFVQIAIAHPHGVDAGDLISKSDKAVLFKMGLVVPEYGGTFFLTHDGVRTWGELHRIIGYTDPWKVKENRS